MEIKWFDARIILDTRGEKTIEVSVFSNAGKFSASAPNGKSKGRFEARPWKISIEKDISAIKKQKLKNISINSFDELEKIEKIFGGKIGANSMIALEYAILKALAKEKNCAVWQLINSNAKKIPMPVGNAVGGGAHTKAEKKPDFQEFLFIPEEKSFKKAVEINKIARETCADILKNIDDSFKRKTNDENAWITSISDELVIDAMKQTAEKIKEKYKINLKIGADVASSGFFKNGRYHYKNQRKSFSKNEQMKYISLISRGMFYIEDFFEQNDFKSFSDILKIIKYNNPNSLIVGDDLTATDYIRILKAIKEKSINAVILKPNQNGSLIELKKIVELCNKNNIKKIFSHRSGETKDNILADIAFGFEADFIKAGICGFGREEKLKRMIEIDNLI